MMMEQNNDKNDSGVEEPNLTDDLVMKACSSSSSSSFSSSPKDRFAPPTLEKESKMEDDDDDNDDVAMHISNNNKTIYPEEESLVDSIIDEPTTTTTTTRMSNDKVETADNSSIPIDKKDEATPRVERRPSESELAVLQALVELLPTKEEESNTSKGDISQDETPSVTAASPVLSRERTKSGEDETDDRQHQEVFAVNRNDVDQTFENDQEDSTTAKLVNESGHAKETAETDILVQPQQPTLSSSAPQECDAILNQTEILARLLHTTASMDQGNDCAANHGQAQAVKLETPETPETRQATTIDTTALTTEEPETEIPATEPSMDTKLKDMIDEAAVIETMDKRNALQEFQPERSKETELNKPETDIDGNVTLVLAKNGTNDETRNDRVDSMEQETSLGSVQAVCRENDVDETEQHTATRESEPESLKGPVATFQTDFVEVGTVNNPLDGASLSQKAKDGEFTDMGDTTDASDGAEPENMVFQHAVDLEDAVSRLSENFQVDSSIKGSMNDSNGATIRENEADLKVAGPMNRVDENVGPTTDAEDGANKVLSEKEIQSELDFSNASKDPTFEDLTAAVRDASKPIGMRMRAAYFLRTSYSNDTERQLEVLQALGDGLRDERHGSLMRHEFAYIMGQLRDERCCSVLEETLQCETNNVMVRHEAAEALGAIGAARSKSVITKVMEYNKHLPELAQTCQISLNVMEWRERGGDPSEMPAACACMLNPYSSIDPAPPHPSHAAKSIQELGDILCDSNLPIFERYRAMFSMRNIGGADAVQQLCRALIEDTSSALLRHEVAYVLGQMQHPISVEALETSLRRKDEHCMVRHESAEALGAIDGRWEDVERILFEFKEDENDVVRESCLVALDAADYWGHNSTHTKMEDESPFLNTFASQKARPSRILANHFNVASACDTGLIANENSADTDSTVEGIAILEDAETSQNKEEAAIDSIGSRGTSADSTELSYEETITENMNDMKVANLKEEIGAHNVPTVAREYVTTTRELHIVAEAPSVQEMEIAKETQEKEKWDGLRQYVDEVTTSEAAENKREPAHVAIEQTGRVKNSSSDTTEETRGEKSESGENRSTVVVIIPEVVTSDGTHFRQTDPFGKNTVGQDTEKEQRRADIEIEETSLISIGAAEESMPSEQPTDTSIVAGTTETPALGMESLADSGADTSVAAGDTESPVNFAQSTTGSLYQSDRELAIPFDEAKSSPGHINKLVDAETLPAPLSPNPQKEEAVPDSFTSPLTSEDVSKSLLGSLAVLSPTRSNQKEGISDPFSSPSRTRDSNESPLSTSPGKVAIPKVFSTKTAEIFLSSPSRRSPGRKKIAIPEVFRAVQGSPPRRRFGMARFRVFGSVMPDPTRDISPENKNFEEVLLTATDMSVEMEIMRPFDEPPTASELLQEGEPFVPPIQRTKMESSSPSETSFLPPGPTSAEIILDIILKDLKEVLGEKEDEPAVPGEKENIAGFDKKEEEPEHDPVPEMEPERPREEESKPLIEASASSQQWDMRLVSERAADDSEALEASDAVGPVYTSSGDEIADKSLCMDPFPGISQDQAACCIVM